tara:strand:- start:57598 stop:58989 length:1392 start_codon:yes stop_codon:yes gene_type:complete
LELHNITALSPIDGRYSQKSSISDLRGYMSEFGLIKYRVIIEIAWLKYLSELDSIPHLDKLSKEIDNSLSDLVHNFSPNDALEVKNIEAETNHDVKAVEYYLAKKLSTAGANNKVLSFIHFACTSEDINNLSYALMLKDVRSNLLEGWLTSLITKLSHLSRKYSKIAMLSRTHGQAATPTTLGKELSVYHIRLKNQLDRLLAINIYGKMNGAVGNYNAHVIAYPDVNWTNETKQFIENFDLTQSTHTTQIESHDWISEYMQSLMRLNTVIIDLCQDMWSYISLGYFKSIINNKEVGSSTMPHKVNPIDFENAEGNLGVANANLGFLSNKLPQSRWQRDLTDSTCLRSSAIGIGHSLLAIESCLNGINKVEPDIKKISSDLAKNYELLAEPIQTVMRKYGISDAYDQLKNLTRGKQITKEDLKVFISSIDGIPEDDKNMLLLLSPEDYVGLAIDLANSDNLKDK